MSWEGMDSESRQRGRPAFGRRDVSSEWRVIVLWRQLWVLWEDALILVG